MPRKSRRQRRLRQRRTSRSQRKQRGSGSNNIRAQTGGAEAIRIMFGAQEVRDGQVVSLEQAQQPFSFLIDGNPNDLYTVIIYDPDAVVPDYIHYFVLNVKNNDPGKGNILYSYQPAAPPPGTGQHKYVVLVCKQREFIQPFAVPEGRAGASVEALLEGLRFEKMSNILFIIDAPAA